jgi:hypothetical protein
MRRRLLQTSVLALLGLTLLWGCGWDNTLRAYLTTHFWLPFAKRASHLPNKKVPRANTPFAGMTPVEGQTPLHKLRAAYQTIAIPRSTPFDATPIRAALAAARADSTLTSQQKEEVDLIAAKLEMRLAEPDESISLSHVQDLLEAFLKTARTPELLSEARGWLAYTYYLAGDQTAAGKIYLDELNRPGSNLSRETILNSLRLTYGYTGGPELEKHLDSYFDTPEHAIFAIELITNPTAHLEEPPQPGQSSASNRNYTRIRALLDQNRHLFQRGPGSRPLALLSMRVALRMADLPGALKIANALPPADPTRADPDFLWMLASTHFLLHHYPAAEPPLLALFRSTKASPDQKAAAAYGLCGVYQQLKNPAGQLSYAVWLKSAGVPETIDLGTDARIEDRGIYWAPSGWDLYHLLEYEAPIEVLESYIQQNPKQKNLRLVQYALAVRLSRAGRYEEAANLYDSIHAIIRGPRLHRLAALDAETRRPGLDQQQQWEARYNLAKFIGDNPDRIFFNDSLWYGMQRYALKAEEENRLPAKERQSLIEAERKLRDDQEELWQAAQLLQDLTRQAGHTPQGRKSATLAIQYLSALNERFGREPEIHQAAKALAPYTH